MTRKEAAKLKRTLLGLRWDINLKTAKLQRLAKRLVENALEHARFTESDYNAFYRSRRINP
jgi:hypothetical protein